MTDATITPIDSRRHRNQQRTPGCDVTVTFHLGEEVTPEIFLKRVAQACGDAYALRPGEGVSVPGYRIDVASFRQNTKTRRLARSFDAASKRASKLTADRVSDIRMMLKDGAEPQRIADHYKIDPATVRKIRDRKIWKSVP